MARSRSSSETDPPRVVIVGAGFAGIEAAQALRRAPVDVMLVDRNNYHKFQPLLYQIATAGLTSGDVTMPVRDLLRGQDNAHFRRATIADIDPDARRIYAKAGASMTYDVLILGVGAVTNYVDIDGVRAHAFPLKDVPDAINLRNHVLEAFETADCNVALRNSCALDAVVVGGGPTGVETAAMLTELFRRTMCRDFDWVEPDTAQVHLVDRGSTTRNRRWRRAASTCSSTPRWRPLRRRESTRTTASSAPEPRCGPRGCGLIRSPRRWQRPWT